MSGQLTKERLQKLFARMDRLIGHDKETAEIYIVGGALVALEHNNERVTRGVDARILSGHKAVRRAVQTIADEEKLSPYWLNEAMTVYEPGEDRNPRPIYNGTNLTVTGASRNRLIAMKLNAGRDADIEDLKVLLSEADVQSAEEARRIHRTVYGNRPMAENADQYLIDRFVKRQGEGVREPGARPSSAQGAATESGRAKGTYDR